MELRTYIHTNKISESKKNLQKFFWLIEKQVTEIKFGHGFKGE